MCEGLRKDSKRSLRSLSQHPDKEDLDEFYFAQKNAISVKFIHRQ